MLRTPSLARRMIVCSAVLSSLLLALPAEAERKRARKKAKAAEAGQSEASQSEAGQAEWQVAAAPGPEFTVEVDTSEGTWMNLDLSPDGSEIVFDLLGDLYLLPIEGGEARAITSGAAWDMQPKFSPDGREIAFTSDRSGGDNIWVVGRGADGSWSETRQISDESFRLPNSPAWSPDGEYIAARKHFTSRRSLGTGEIWLWHAGGEGGGLQLNEKPNEQKDLGEPEFSPDGRYVYFSQDTTPGDTFEYSKDSNGEIYTIRRIDRQTGEIETVIDGFGGAVRPTPSPDGSRIAFVRRVRFQSTLFVHDLASGENTPLYDGLDRDMQEIWAIHGVYPSFAWTPDGRELVFWAGGGIHRIDVESGTVTPIPFRARATHAMKQVLRYPVEVAPERFRTKMLRWVRVSPDGGQAVFQALGYLWTRQLGGDGEDDSELGPARRLTRQSDHFEVYPSFSRDGSWVIYASWNDGELGAIRAVPSTGGESIVLTTEPGHYSEPALSPDGATLVYRKGGGGFITSPLWSKEPGLYRLSVDLEAAPGAAPSGDAVRFARSGAEPHFGADPGRVYYTEFAGRGKRMLVSQRVDGPLSGDAERRELAESENATQFRVSPDGRRLAFSERFNAYVLPLPDASKPLALSPKFDALPTRRVSRDAGDYLHWSGDSQTLYWTTGPELFSERVTEALARGGDEQEAAEPVAGVDLGFEVDTDRPRGVIALTGAKLLTMAREVNGADAEGIIEGGTVVVEGHRIVAVGPDDEVEIPAGAHTVDAAGKVILPGLLDVHWHGPQGTREVVPQRNQYNFSSLAFGVTTAHDPSNDTSTFFAASEMQKAGSILGPRLFSTGTILYGAAGSFKAEVDSLDDARSHLRRLQAVGAFSVKSYNQPRRDQRQQIVAAARELGMMVVNEGGALFNHNMTMVMDGHTGIEHSLSVGAIYDDVRQYWGATEVGNTPTLGVAFGGTEGERYWYHHTDVYDNERLLAFVPRERVDARARRRMMAPEEEYNHILAAQVVKDLHDAGVPIQLGAHGQREGLAAHWEMWMFEQGGMTPMEALRAGTIQGARYLGLDGDLGSLEPGKLADLIVLEKDPLANLRDSEHVELTMLNGRLYDAMTLEQLAPEQRPAGKLWFQR